MPGILKTDPSGDSPLADWLKEYSEEDSIEVNPVICRNCGNAAFEMQVDEEEEGIGVVCTECGTQKVLLDCDEVWEDCEPVTVECSECGGKFFNVSVGFVRRDSGSVKWVYIGSRCTECGGLDSPLDWKISYEPTEEMEKNI
ncbi:MAG: hypothetical protein NC078_02910 [Ruminococcus sp.]|nr:hypothetical protein [Ruminococcus sp.]